MSTRSSGRAPKPPQRLITIEEGPQLASRSDRVSFAQLGEQHAREVESRGGEEPTDEEVDEVSVVPSGPGSAAAHPTTEPRQKKTRVSKKWNTLYERHGCCSYCCTRGTVAAALLYLCIIILVYHPEMLYVPVCRTTTTYSSSFNSSLSPFSNITSSSTRYQA